jgi:ABC-type glutathione transport system ATPase component
VSVRDLAPAVRVETRIGPTNGSGRPVIRVERLSREVQGKKITDGVRLDVSPGEVIAIVGPSGAGKSSLLRILGIVWVPGLMAGMTLSGSNPVYAAV